MNDFDAIARAGERLSLSGVLDDSWSWFLEEAEDLFDDDETLEEDPEKHRETVEGYLALLGEIRQNLEEIQQRLSEKGPQSDKLGELFRGYVQRYNSLTLGILRDARAEDPAALPRTFGYAAALIVAGVALGVSAVAWAVVAYEEAEATRDQTALMLEDLRVRDQASREGRTLQTTTVDLPRPPDDALPLWPFAVGAAGAVGLGFLLYKASNTLRS